MGMPPLPQPPNPLPPIGIKRNDILFEPGDVAPISGEYQIVNEEGKVPPILRGGKCRVAKGEQFPPTPTPGQKYKLVDKTITKSA